MDDQDDHCVEYICEHYEGPIAFRYIRSIAKGEKTDRPELEEIKTLVRTKQVDVIAAEDLGRIMRSLDLVKFCGSCANKGVRVLTIHECFDNFEEDWEEAATRAAHNHASNNNHLSKRIKHKLRNRFKKLGHALRPPIFGYTKPPGAKSDQELQRDLTVAHVIEEMKRRVKLDPNCSAIARYINSLGLRWGENLRTAQKVEGSHVRSWFRNRLIYGDRTRCDRISYFDFDTGSRPTKKNPDGPLVRECPHLAWMTKEEFDEINGILDKANAHCRRDCPDGVDPRAGVPRKQTRCPGNHARCAVCGRNYQFGGNGQKHWLMCPGAKSHQCWNGLSFHGPTLVKRIAEQVLTATEALPNFEPEYAGLVEQVGKEEAFGIGPREKHVAEKERELATMREQVAAAIRAFAGKPRLLEEAGRMEDRLTALEAEIETQRRELERLRGAMKIVPPSLLEIRSQLREEFCALAQDSEEFASLLRLIVRDLFLFPVRLFDGGHPVLRARFTLWLPRRFPGIEGVPGAGELLSRAFVVDAFDPPQREALRDQAVELMKSCQTQRDAAAALGPRVSQAVVNRALKLNAAMLAAGVADPYVKLLGPPEDYAKLRRHRHPEYVFRPMEGFPKLG